MRKRTYLQKVIDFITFPIRAFSMFEKGAFGLTSLADERFDYVSHEVSGSCLDVGCGRNNLFVKEYLGGNGAGIDVFLYEGLTDENLLQDPTHFPFEDSSFDNVTFIACINHVPEPIRDAELAEAYRCVKPGGRIIVTMGNPLAEIMVHQVVKVFDALFGTTNDIDSERGMEEDEDYYLSDIEISQRLGRAGFAGIDKKYFLTQWGLNHMLIGRKLPASDVV
jgi:SAM-dependent methyltransferase